MGNSASELASPADFSSSLQTYIEKRQKNETNKAFPGKALNIDSAPKHYLLPEARDSQNLTDGSRKRKQPFYRPSLTESFRDLDDEDVEEKLYLKTVKNRSNLVIQERQENEAFRRRREQEKANMILFHRRNRTHKERLQDEEYDRFVREKIQMVADRKSGQWGGGGELAVSTASLATSQKLRRAKRGASSTSASPPGTPAFTCPNLDCLICAAPLTLAHASGASDAIAPESESGEELVKASPRSCAVKESPAAKWARPRCAHGRFMGKQPTACGCTVPSSVPKVPPVLPPSHLKSEPTTCPPRHSSGDVASAKIGSTNKQRKENSTRPKSAKLKQKWKFDGMEYHTPPVREVDNYVPYDRGITLQFLLNYTGGGLWDGLSAFDEKSEAARKAKAQGKLTRQQRYEKRLERLDTIERTEVQADGPPQGSQYSLNDGVPLCKVPALTKGTCGALQKLSQTLITVSKGEEIDRDEAKHIGIEDRPNLESIGNEAHVNVQHGDKSALRTEHGESVAPQLESQFMPSFEGITKFFHREILPMRHSTKVIEDSEDRRENSLVAPKSQPSKACNIPHTVNISQQIDTKLSKSEEVNITFLSEAKENIPNNSFGVKKAKLSNASDNLEEVSEETEMRKTPDSVIYVETALCNDCQSNSSGGAEALDNAFGKTDASHPENLPEEHSYNDIKIQDADDQAEEICSPDSTSTTKRPSASHHTATKQLNSETELLPSSDMEPIRTRSSSKANLHNNSKENKSLHNNEIHISNGPLGTPKTVRQSARIKEKGPRISYGKGVLLNDYLDTIIEESSGVKKRLRRNGLNAQDIENVEALSESSDQYSLEEDSDVSAKSEYSKVSGSDSTGDSLNSERPPLSRLKRPGRHRADSRYSDYYMQSDKEYQEMNSGDEDDFSDTVNSELIPFSIESASEKSNRHPISRHGYSVPLQNPPPHSTDLRRSKRKVKHNLRLASQEPEVDATERPKFPARSQKKRTRSNSGSSCGDLGTLEQLKSVPVYCVGEDSGGKPVQFYGRLTRGTVKCDCCKKNYDLMQFLRHAKSESNTPYADIIMMKEGVSIGAFLA